MAIISVMLLMLKNTKNLLKESKLIAMGENAFMLRQMRMRKRAREGERKCRKKMKDDEKRTLTSELKIRARFFLNAHRKEVVEDIYTHMHVQSSHAVLKRAKKYIFLLVS